MFLNLAEESLGHRIVKRAGECAFCFVLFLLNLKDRPGVAHNGVCLTINSAFRTHVLHGESG